MSTGERLGAGHKINPPKSTGEYITSFLVRSGLNNSSAARQLGADPSSFSRAASNQTRLSSENAQKLIGITNPSPVEAIAFLLSNCGMSFEQIRSALDEAREQFGSPELFPNDIVYKSDSRQMQPEQNSYTQLALNLDPDKPETLPSLKVRIRNFKTIQKISQDFPNLAAETTGWISVRDVAERYGCSYTVAERALNSLTQNGKLTHVKRVGYFVSGQDAPKVTRKHRDSKLQKIIDELPDFASQTEGWIRAKDIAVRYGCSKSTAEHALKILTENGVIRHKPQFGYSSPGKEPELRQPLEPSTQRSILKTKIISAFPNMPSPIKIADIVSIFGATPKVAHSVLSDLIKEGIIIKTKHGEYKQVNVQEDTELPTAPTPLMTINDAHARISKRLGRNISVDEVAEAIKDMKEKGTLPENLHHLA